jgi:hypothetical protein
VAALDHPWQVQMRQRDDRRDIDLHHLHLSSAVGSVEQSIRAKAGIVHQQVHGDMLFLGKTENLLGSDRQNEIGWKDFDADAVLLRKPLGKRLQALAPPRGQD